MILLKIFLSLVIYWAMFNVIAPFAPASFGPLLLTGLAALLSLPLLYVFYRRERGRHGQEARPEYRRLGPSLALILLFGAAAQAALPAAMFCGAGMCALGAVFFLIWHRTAK